MPTIQEFNAVMKAIDDETNRIAAKVTDLLQQVASGGLTATEEAALLETAQAELAKLQGIAADPTNPVPTP